MTANAANAALPQMRRCGECTLCCSLLPVVPLNKKAGERCINQRGLGCKVHEKAGFPTECRLWNCRWLVDRTTTKLLRPNLSHYVIDIVPDFVTAVDKGHEVKVPVIQVWIDPRYPEAHKDPNLREWLRQHEPECLMLVRYDAFDARCLIPPHMSDTGDWEEIGGPRMKSMDGTHSAEEIAAVLTNTGALK
jgi:hypothetical protein